jgi:hypothetical protein
MKRPLDFGVRDSVDDTDLKNPTRLAVGEKLRHDTPDLTLPGVR